MIKWIILLLLIMTTPCCGQDLVPGSYRIEYGGFYRIAAREIGGRLERFWRNQTNDRYERGDINANTWERQHSYISAHLFDWQFGAPWYTRAWFHSLVEEKGGAPPNNSIVVHKGNDFLLINAPLFSLSNTFALRFKSFEASLDFKSRRPIMLGGSVPEPRAGWKFKFSPEVSIAASKILKEPGKVIRRVGIRIRATHTVRNKQLVGLRGRLWYNPSSGDFFAAFQLSLLQW